MIKIIVKLYLKGASSKAVFNFIIFSIHYKTHHEFYSVVFRNMTLIFNQLSVMKYSF